MVLRVNLLDGVVDKKKIKKIFDKAKSLSLYVKCDLLDCSKSWKREEISWSYEEFFKNTIKMPWYTTCIFREGYYDTPYYEFCISASGKNSVEYFLWVYVYHYHFSDDILEVE